MAKVMFSGRFDGGMKETYLRQTAAALEGLGFKTLVVKADAGQQFGPQTVEYLDESDVIVAMVCDTYGELTESSYCTYWEVKFFLDNRKKPVIPVQLYKGAWPPRPDKPGGAQNKFYFTPDRIRVIAIREDGEFDSPDDLAGRISKLVKEMLAKEPVPAKKTEEKEDDLNLLDAKGWYNLGCRGGGQVGRGTYSTGECYIMALTLNPDHAWAWNNLGTVGGGTVGTDTYDPRQCHVKAVTLDPKNAPAWYNLGVQGGGTVGGKAYSEVECYTEALTLDPNKANAWLNLGHLGGGTVGDKAYSQAECWAKRDEIEAAG